MNTKNKIGDGQAVHPTLKFVVEGRTFESHKQFMTDIEIKEFSGLPADAELFLAICEPWQDEKLKPGEPIDLARPGIEQFFIKRTLPFILKGKKYESASQYIRGLRLRKLGDIPDDEEIWLKIEKPWEDELITDDTWVNLARPGIEEFVSRKTDHKVTLIVNAREKPWNKKTITFEEVVILQYGSYDHNPLVKYSVTYKNGPRENPEGIMSVGETLLVKNKMNFHVGRTIES